MTPNGVDLFFVFWFLFLAEQKCRKRLVVEDAVLQVACVSWPCWLHAPGDNQITEGMIGV